MTDKHDDDQSVVLKQQIKEWYKNLLNDEYFEPLETELQKPNIFNILGIGRMEIRHSNFLAWLLDPNASHGLGNRFLIRILRDLAIEGKRSLDILDINDLNFSNVEINREVPIKYEDQIGYIDILIVFRDKKYVDDKQLDNNLVICIENKIDTTDAEKQLEMYQDYVKETFKEEDGYKNILVYLTPNGANPKKGDVTKWSNYSYTKIIKHLENIENSITDSIIKTYISDYLSTLKSEIMGTKESAADLAYKIYEQNKEIFDFVNNSISKEVINAIWEDDSKKWLKEVVEQLLSKIKDIDKDKKYELGFTKNYISIKREGKIVYTLYPNKDPKYSLEIILTKNEDKQKIVVLLYEEKIDKSKWNENSVYFIINNFDDVLKQNPNIFEKIHNKRFD